MAEELEVGVRLVPDTSELEDVEDREVSAGAGGGGVTGAGGTGGGDAAAGGFAGAETGELLGKGGILAGLLAAILSQLKPVAQFVKLIFRILSLAILPVIQLLVTALQPLLTNLARTTEATEQPIGTIQRAGQKFTNRNPGLAASLGQDFLTGATTGNVAGNVGQTLGAEAIASVLDERKSSADLTDEGRKKQQANLVQDIIELIP